MNERDIIDELDSIIAYCDVTKEKAAGLRRKLARLHAPASRKRGGLSQEVIAEVLAKRKKFRNKKSLSCN
jgi:hypothetical protein